MFEPAVGLMPLDDLVAGLRVDALRDPDPAGKSIERLLQAVERHATLEADALDQYEYLAQVSGDPVIALVMRLILDDEVRHHGLLGRIAATLRDALYWTHTPASLPKSDTHATPTPAAEELATVARALIEEERTGARALRDLATRQKGLDGGLDSLLLEMMAMDSDKHARLLQFVHKRLEARRAQEVPS
jgi:rubrerythrin